MNRGLLTGYRAHSSVFNPSPIDNPANWTNDEGYDYEFNATTLALPVGWSWVNQGGATYAEQFGGGVLVGTSQAGAQIRSLVRSLPTAPSWTVLLKVDMGMGPTAAADCGLTLRESSSGKFYNFFYANDATVGINHWSTPSTWAATDISETSRLAPPRFFRVVKNSATSWDFSYSCDGLAWRVLSSAFNPAYCTPDQIGFYSDSNNGGSNQIACQWFRLRTGPLAAVESSN